MVLECLEVGEASTILRRDPVLVQENQKLIE